MYDSLWFVLHLFILARFYTIKVSIKLKSYLSLLKLLVQISSVDFLKSMSNSGKKLKKKYIYVNTKISNLKFTKLRRNSTVSICQNSEAVVRVMYKIVILKRKACIFIINPAQVFSWEFSEMWKNMFLCNSFKLNLWHVTAPSMQVKTAFSLKVPCDCFKHLLFYKQINWTTVLLLCSFWTN